MGNLELIRVAIVGDVRLHRDCVALALEQSKGIAVVGSSSLCSQLPDALLSLGVNVVLIQAKTLCCVEAEPLVQWSAHNARIVAYGLDDGAAAVRCAEAGAAGYVMSEATLDDLCTTIHRVSRGEVHCPAHVTALVFGRLRTLGAEHLAMRATGPLTRREQDVLALVDKGLTNKEIARQLGIGVSTVKNHVHNVRTKVQASRRSQAGLRVRTPLSLPRRNGKGLDPE
jgi:two-component system nitrate/nitrite response regulator NarL